MRQDFLAAPVLQPDDDPGLIWLAQFGEAPEDDDVEAQFLEPDAEGLWGCTLSGVSGELEVSDFRALNDLQDWLESHDIPIAN